MSKNQRTLVSVVLLALLAPAAGCDLEKAQADDTPSLASLAGKLKTYDFSPGKTPRKLKRLGKLSAALEGQAAHRANRLLFKTYMDWIAYAVTDQRRPGDKVSAMVETTEGRRQSC